MKLVVFAHTPPPHHGQSYMVELLLKGLRADPQQRIEVLHVNARFSDSVEEIGRGSLRKVARALRFTLAAIGLGLRHRARALYYIPAPPLRAAIYRDWMVMALCRPFFPRLILHWHACGLGEWLATEARPWERWLTRRLLGRATLSIVLRPFNRTDAEALEARRIAIVPNGIPDPCPAFAAEVLPRRQARSLARRKLQAGASLTAAERAAAGGDPEVFRVLFLSLCHSGKGFFDTLDAIALANEQLRGSPFRAELMVAGSFWNDREREQFNERVSRPDLHQGGPMVHYRGFVSGEAKQRLLLESDCLCFPTKMPESFGLVLLEGMACGLALITTDWRNIPELLPPASPGIVPPGNPEQIARKITELLTAEGAAAGRAHFLANYTEQVFQERMRAVLGDVLGR